MANNYTGFGETHGLREWARRLGVNKDTLRYWLVGRKLSIEEFAAKNGIEYTSAPEEEQVKIADREKWDREVIRLVNSTAKAKKELTQLFTRSGYDVRLLTIALDIDTSKHRLVLVYDDEYVGFYQVYRGVLSMKRDSINISALKHIVDSPKIHRYCDGCWGLHRETKIGAIDLINPNNNDDSNWMD